MLREMLDDGPDRLTLTFVIESLAHGDTEPSAAALVAAVAELAAEPSLAEAAGACGGMSCRKLVWIVSSFGAIACVDISPSPPPPAASPSTRRTGRCTFG